MALLGLFRHVNRGDAAGVVLPGDVREAGVLHHAGQALLVGERLDGLRKVHETVAVARDQATPERDEVLQVEVVQRAPNSIGC